MSFKWSDNLRAEKRIKKIVLTSSTIMFSIHKQIEMGFFYREPRHKEFGIGRIG